MIHVRARARTTTEDRLHERGQIGGVHNSVAVGIAWQGGSGCRECEAHSYDEEPRSRVEKAVRRC